MDRVMHNEFLNALVCLTGHQLMFRRAVIIIILVIILGLVWEVLPILLPGLLPMLPI
jgi:vacuolar-type H+-ATPase subunit I/STV1